MAAEPLRLGLIGFGTIGSGVVAVLHEHRTVIAERLGFPLELAAIADIDLETDRGVPTRRDPAHGRLAVSRRRSRHRHRDRARRWYHDRPGHGLGCTRGR